MPKMIELNLVSFLLKKDHYIYLFVIFLRYHRLHKYGKGFELDIYDTVHNNLPPMLTWNGEQIKKIKPEITYKEVMETEEGLNKWLELMYKYGLVIMKGMAKLCLCFFL